MKYKIKGKVRKNKDLSVIIPTYNEAENIRELVKKLKENLKKIDFEVIIIDDNSADGTAEAIDKLVERSKGEILALHRYNKRGIFSAIQDGIKVANGKYIVMMDSDLSHPPKKIREMWKLREDFDIVSGSRFIRGGRMRAGFLRKYGSFILNFLCSLIANLKVKDVIGGFHLMKKKAFEFLKFKYNSKFGEFDLELLYRARQKGYSIKEIPFIYQFRKKGKSKMSENIIGLFSMSLVYLKRAIQLRFLG